jgi:HAD superfamily hydrolase (TIGR01549 family)
MIKAVIFDFDGVIVESVDIKTAAFAELFKKEGKRAVKKIVDYHLVNTGVSRYEKFRYIYKEILKRDLSEDEFDELCDKFASLVVTSVVRAPYVRGCDEFLEACSSTYKCFVVSATPQLEIEDIIRLRGMKKRFTAVYGSPREKTDAVKEIINAYHLLPEELLYVGDALSDYEAAAENHTRFIARINDNETIFSGIKCVKVQDLSTLKNEIENIR